MEVKIGSGRTVDVGVKAGDSRKEITFTINL